MVDATPTPGDECTDPVPYIWLGKTPTGADLERMPLQYFHRAIDRLEEETVPESYWRQVVASRQTRHPR